MKKLASLTMLMSLSAFGNSEFLHGDCKVKLDESHGDKFTTAQLEQIRKKGFILSDSADMTFSQAMDSRKRGNLYLIGENKTPKSLAGTSFSSEYYAFKGYQKNFDRIPHCRVIAESDFQGECPDLNGVYRMTDVQTQRGSLSFGMYPAYLGLKQGAILKIDQKNCLDYKVSIVEGAFDNVKRISVPRLQNDTVDLSYKKPGLSKILYSKDEVIFHHSSPTQGWTAIGVNFPISWSYFQDSYDRVKISKSGDKLIIVHDSKDVNGKKHQDQGLAEKVD